MMQIHVSVSCDFTNFLMVMFSTVRTKNSEKYETRETKTCPEFFY